LDKRIVAIKGMSNKLTTMLFSPFVIVLIAACVNVVDANGKVRGMMTTLVANPSLMRDVCVENNKTQVWETATVPGFLADTLIQGGAREGQCTTQCEIVCNHLPCYRDFFRFRDRNDGKKKCKCLPNKTFKCSMVNTRCNNLDESCQCLPGFAGNASAPAGCPDIGFSLPDLPYKKDAIEPYIDTQTMTLHHDRHHQTAIDSLNKIVNGTAEAALHVIKLVETAITTNRTAIRNNAGGHYNHAFFWRILTSANASAAMKPSDQLQALINVSFGNTSTMIAQFNAAGTPSALFGSGWVWVNVNGAGDKLVITTSPNQDNPLMFPLNPLYPIIGLDVWEHAYYLKYQNLRNDYVKSFWKVINWDVVSDNCRDVIEDKHGVYV
jgi:superoxide dismutase, Fe-Mn family